MCTSRATHRAFIACSIPCVTWYEGTAQLLNLTEFKSLHLALCYWLQRLTDEGGEETGVPGGNPQTTSFRKCHILKPENSSHNRDSNPHCSIGSRLGKSRRANHYTTCPPKPMTMLDGQAVRRPRPVRQIREFPPPPPVSNSVVCCSHTLLYFTFVCRLYHLGRRGKKDTFVCCTSECLGRGDTVQR